MTATVGNLQISKKRSTCSTLQVSSAPSTLLVGLLAATLLGLLGFLESTLLGLLGLLVVLVSEAGCVGG
jgi:hypothetical protein